MSGKRPICDDIYDPIYHVDEELENVINKRKKLKTGEKIGYCDQCNDLTCVRSEKDNPYFNICVDCEVEELDFLTDGLTITSEINPSKIETCPGCVDNQPNQLAHIGPGGCLEKMKKSICDDLDNDLGDDLDNNLDNKLKIIKE